LKGQPDNLPDIFQPLIQQKTIFPLSVLMEVMEVRHMGM